jgi:hypothetical protein
MAITVVVKCRAGTPVGMNRIKTPPRWQLLEVTNRSGFVTQLLQCQPGLVFPGTGYFQTANSTYGTYFTLKQNSCIAQIAENTDIFCELLQFSLKKSR